MKVKQHGRHRRRKKKRTHKTGAWKETEKICWKCAMCSQTKGQPVSLTSRCKGEMREMQWLRIYLEYVWKVSTCTVLGVKQQTTTIETGSQTNRMGWVECMLYVMRLAFLRLVVIIIFVRTIFCVCMCAGVLMLIFSSIFCHYRAILILCEDTARCARFIIISIKKISCATCSELIIISMSL